MGEGLQDILKIYPQVCSLPILFLSLQVTTCESFMIGIPGSINFMANHGMGPLESNRNHMDY